MQQKIIVIADASPRTRARFGRALDEAGHLAVTVAHATDLMPAVQEPSAKPDLLVLDLHLPGGGGLELIDAIRRTGGRALPILIFSGSVRGAPEVRQLAALDIAGYISESCSRDQIVPAIAPHLFPDNFNRRGSPRIALGIPVAFRHEGSISAAMTLDLGKGGVAVRTMTPLDAADKVYARFRLPGSERDIEAESRVAWSDRRVGMGLQFERVDPLHQQAIDAFIDHHGSARADA